MVLGGIKSYDDDYFIKVQERAIKCLSEFGDSVVGCRKCGKKKIGEALGTKRVCKIEMEKYLKCDKDEIKLKHLEKIMKKMQKALDTMLEN